MTTLGAVSSATTLDTLAADAAFTSRVDLGIYESSWYVSNPCTAVGSWAIDVNRLGVSRIKIPVDCSVDRIGCEVTVVAASSTVRLGIYNADSGGMPDGLVLDAGTIDSAGSTGDKEITINQALTAGVYWLAAVAQGGTPEMRTIYGAGQQIAPVTTALVNSPGYRSDGISGALPSTFALTTIDQPIRVWLRYA